MPNIIQDHSHHQIQVSGAVWTRLRGGLDKGEMEYEFASPFRCWSIVPTPAADHIQSPTLLLDRRCEDSHKAHPVTTRFVLSMLGSHAKSDDQCSWWFAWAALPWNSEGFREERAIRTGGTIWDILIGWYPNMECQKSRAAIVVITTL